MKRSKPNSWTLRVVATVTIAVAFSPLLPGESIPAKSADNSSSAQWSVRVARIDAGHVNLARSFQAAIYENLVEELKKTKRFENVLREGETDSNAMPNLLILKTTVVKYKPGSETQREVTTVSGATKLTVRSQLLTVDGRVVLESTVNGNVRFFGSNLRATHNLARNIAKLIKGSAWPAPEQLAQYSPANSE